MSEVMPFYKEIDRLEAEKKALIGALVRCKKHEKLMAKLIRKDQARNNQLEAILEDYLEHSECGLLCGGCPSATKHCNDCGIQQLEIRARKLLRKEK